MSVFTDNRKKIIDCNSCYMLGVLADNETYYPPYGGETPEPVTIMKNSNGIVMFYIKPLSQDPGPIVEIVDQYMSSSYYVGKDVDQNHSICPYSYMTMDNEEKKQYMFNMLKGKLLLFKPKMQFSARGDKTFKNLEIINVEDFETSDDAEFVPIPVMNMLNNDFERKLWDSSNILLEDYNHAMYQPEYILCKNYLYLDFPDWTKHSTNNRMWSCGNASDKIRKIKFDIESDDVRSRIIQATDNLIFIDKNWIYKFIQNNQEIVETLNELVNVEAPKQNQAEDNIKKQEHDFIMALYDYLIADDFYYPLEDLVNLHNCIKTNPITILAGMSGTGKSKLASYYTKMLDLSEENENLLFLPISPSYTEPGDLLGYLNNTNNLYIPSDTKLVDFLIKASEADAGALGSKKSMYVVIFDEMNLSQVEHWFAPFISLLERDPGERRLTLYSKDAHCINKHTYPDYITLGNNIRFIGTVNVDETTKDFSDRLLDRANVITLNKATLKELKNATVGVEKNKNYNDYKCFTSSTYINWITDKQWIEAFNDLEIEFFDELHKIINKYDSQKGFSFRIARKIGEYINNIPENANKEKMINKMDAIDLQIKQRVITKIKGTEKQYGKLIGIIKDSNSTEPLDSELFNFLSDEKYKSISHFDETKEMIIKKSKELGMYGYAN